MCSGRFSVVVNLLHAADLIKLLIVVKYLVLQGMGDMKAISSLDLEGVAV